MMMRAHFPILLLSADFPIILLLLLTSTHFLPSTSSSQLTSPSFSSQLTSPSSSPQLTAPSFSQLTSPSFSSQPTSPSFSSQLTSPSSSSQPTASSFSLFQPFLIPVDQYMPLPVPHNANCPAILHALTQHVLYPACLSLVPHLTNSSLFLLPIPTPQSPYPPHPYTLPLERKVRIPFLSTISSSSHMGWPAEAAGCSAVSTAYRRDVAGLTTFLKAQVRRTPHLNQLRQAERRTEVLTKTVAAEPGALALPRSHSTHHQRQFTQVSTRLWNCLLASDSCPNNLTNTTVGLQRFKLLVHRWLSSVRDSDTED
ncbi:hypothetical protein Pcinc_044480 [Petrolisthes cinctipes]|uniref:Uncharacterized protein n=1 Tax=Petrolisthes cinctipes TaxID=88211 RepID=A0AAE1BFU6_PETCI|nr:hypothetical protein Pcinc_044480 [Petrolisthes cinctipes]